MEQLNRAKFLEFFNADEVDGAIHVVGVGAIGSHVATTLARLGFKRIHIYDFDKVESHNVANQMFTQEDIGKNKVTAVEEMIKKINPICEVVTHEKGLQEPYVLSGHIFLCVDSIELRNKIVEANKENPYCLSIQDWRMRLTDAQYYFATEKWQYEKLLETMNFTHEEAAEATPVSACGYELSVIYTVQTVVAIGIANFIAFVQKTAFNNVIIVDLSIIDVLKMKWKQKKHCNKLEEQLNKLAKALAAER